MTFGIVKWVVAVAGASFATAVLFYLLGWMVGA